MSGPNAMLAKVLIDLRINLLVAASVVVEERDPNPRDVDAAAKRTAEQDQRVQGNRSGRLTISWSDERLMLEATLRAALDVLSNGREDG